MNGGIPDGAIESTHNSVALGSPSLPVRIAWCLRVHPMLLPSIAGAHGAIPAVPSFTPSSSHAGHRRLLLHPGSTAHALPRLGAVAVPDESLATALLSQQPQQQQQQQQASVRRSRTAQHVQPPTELQQQLTALQQATQQQQQALWQVQAAQQAPARGRQQARPGQSDYSSQNAGNRQGSFQRGHQSPSRQQQQQQQQYQQRPYKQQGYRGYQSDQQDESFPRQQQHNRSWQPSQQGFPQQRWGDQQQQQQRHQSLHRRQQQQQQQISSWQEGDAAGDRQQRFQQQRRHNRPQQQQPNQQQALQRHGSNEIAPSDASDGSSSTSSKPELRFTYGLQQDWSLPTGMAVTYLGSSSGSPTRDRNVSCTVLRLPESLYLVDCGEGSSRQAKLTGMQLEQVDTIFITHLHGDHCFGIGTMLVSLCRAHKAAAAANSSSSSSSSDSSDSLPGPDSPTALRVVGPPRLGELLSSMLFIAGVARQLDQPVYITEFVEDDSEAHDWEPLPPPASVSSFSSPTCQAFIRRLAPTKQLQGQDWPAGLSSRLDSTGLQWESRKRNNVGNFYAKVGLLWELPCRQAMVTAAQLQHRVPCWGYVFEEKVGAGAAAAADAGGSSSGGSAGQGRRVVLLGDTMDSRAIAPAAHGADLVSHEATFAAGMEGKAATAQHSTAWMAGQFAWAIQAKALVLTHFSARYEGSAASKRPPAGHGGQWSRVHDSGHGDASDKEAEERTIKALQREADDQYGLGPILLAIDLLTAHVPTRESPEAAKA